ncbi:MAG TPA: hypothetical protein VH501_04980 [Solirubrobacterales bacterium]
MESRRWTDDRIDDLADATRTGFDRVDRDLRELRQWIFRLTIGMSIGFVSVLATILARGA